MISELLNEPVLQLGATCVMALVAFSFMDRKDRRCQEDHKNNRLHVEALTTKFDYTMDKITSAFKAEIHKEREVFEKNIEKIIEGTKR